MLAYIDPSSGYVIASGFGYILAVVGAFFAAFLGLILLRIKQITSFIKRRPKTVILVGSVIAVMGIGSLVYHLMR